MFKLFYISAAFSKSSSIEYSQIEYYQDCLSVIHILPIHKFFTYFLEVVCYSKTCMNVEEISKCVCLRLELQAVENDWLLK